LKESHKYLHPVLNFLCSWFSVINIFTNTLTFSSLSWASAFHCSVHHLLTKTLISLAEKCACLWCTDILSRDTYDRRFRWFPEFQA
jgi:hypothetical protein